MAQTKRIFLASSAELLEDRRAFQIQIDRRNKDWVPNGVHLDLVVWEDFLDVMTHDGLQKAYNRAINECDLFVMLFWTRVGKYTLEEFETAFKQFQATHKPFILTYFKNAPHTASREHQQSLWAFQDKLKALGHYQTEYQNTEGLLLHFVQQLDKLVANGFIRFEPEPEAPAASPSYHATLTGSGAIAQGTNATAVGAGGVHTGGGAYVTGSVHVTGGDFVGRDKITHGSSPAELAAVFAPLLQVVKQQAPPAVQAHAVAKVAELQAEAQKGSGADDSKLAGIIDSLAGMVPGAIGWVVQTFAAPILTGLVGPLTKLVLGRPR